MPQDFLQPNTDVYRQPAQQQSKDQERKGTKVQYTNCRVQQLQYCGYHDPADDQEYKAEK